MRGLTRGSEGSQVFVFTNLLLKGHLFNLPIPESAALRRYCVSLGRREGFGVLDRTGQGGGRMCRLGQMAEGWVSLGSQGAGADRSPGRWSLPRQMGPPRLKPSLGLSEKGAFIGKETLPSLGWGGIKGNGTSGPGGRCDRRPGQETQPH